ncbi:MAG: methionine synthase, partial [Actinobacteria bacterium]|nr:methionine synthase [Actinomycetota bacterium]
GPAEMSEHLRQLSKHSQIPVMVMPNAGLPILQGDGAVYPLTPSELATAHEQFIKEFGLSLVGGCCGTTPEHLKAVVERVGGVKTLERKVAIEPGVSSLYQHVALDQDNTYLAIGERTNANGSKAFREAMLEERWDDCVEIAKRQVRDGAHLLDVSVDYVGRDGVRDMQEIVSRFASASTLPLVIDSTEPEVMKAGLELIGGRPVINSVNFEDGDGPNSRFQRSMPLVKEHGAAVIALTIDEQGQARTKEDKVRIASRLIDTLVQDWGMRVSDIIMDCLTFPIATGQEETRRDAIETIEAIREVNRLYPGVHTTLGVSNVSFGLNPVSRSVLNSVFLHEAYEAGLDTAIIDAAKIVPLASIPEDQMKVALDLVYDRREYDDAGNITYDPLQAMLELFAGVNSSALKDARAAELAALSVTERLERRIIDGEAKGLEQDLDQAREDGVKPLDIINNHLLEGMKIVGERFGKG